MYYLGKPVGIIDVGATFTSYIGLTLLGSVFISIGIFASSLTNSQIVAFILAMFLCWIFYDGFNLLGNFSQIGELDYIIQYIGIAFHYDSIKKGVIEISDLLYFFTKSGSVFFAQIRSNPKNACNIHNFKFACKKSASYDNAKLCLNTV